jgi:thioredoxin reductase
MKIYDTAVIGGGPAGIAAAVQLCRYGIIPFLFEKESPGGLLRNANFVENYLGFYNGVSGEKLVELFNFQLNKTKTKLKLTEVLSVDYSDNNFIVKTDKEMFLFERIIIASGTKPLKDVDFKIDDKIGNRIFHEIHSLTKLKGKHIAIVGSGDAAFDYAINLSKRDNSISVFNRSDRIKALDILKEQADNRKNIIYYENTIINKVESNNNGLELSCYNIADNKRFIKKVSHLIIAIGRKPNLSFLSENILNSMEELESRGVFYLAGDVKNGHYRQTAIAVGDGIKAAMKIHDNKYDK